jgi:hypothetical protein
MTGQAGGDQVHLLSVTAEEGAEDGAGPGQLAVATCARKQLVDGVHDLVVPATPRPARPGDRHGEARQDERFGEDRKELVRPGAAWLMQHRLRGSPGHGYGEAVDLLAQVRCG